MVGLVFAALALACRSEQVDADGVSDGVLIVGEDALGANRADNEDNVRGMQDGPVDEAVDVENEVPFLDFGWENVLAGELPSLGAIPRLNVRNLTERNVNVELEVHWDTGTTKMHRRSLAAVDLGSDDKETIAVEFADLGIPLAKMRYAGQLLAVARVYDAETGEQLQQLTTPSLYFHPEKSGLRTYDATTLRNRFNAGNFQASLHASVPELELVGPENSWVTDRVLGDADADAREEAKPPSEATRATYTLCVDYQVLTNDAGFQNPAGVAEDFWVRTNAGKAKNAYGVRIVIGSTTYNTSTSTGCVTFSASSSTQTVRVYAYATNGSGSYVRIHNGSSSTTASYPGQTYSILVNNVQLVQNGTKHLSVGSFGARWTAMGSLATTLYRFNYGNGNIAFHVAETTSSTSSAYSNNIGANRSYIRISTSGASPSQRAKFIVAHEMGHAIANQNAEVSTQSPKSSNYNESGGGCDDGGGYGMGSQEWSSRAHSEAFAHFVSARTWNNKSSGGAYRWRGVNPGATTYDLERWNTTNTAGGRLENVCCTGTFNPCNGADDGTGTILDWTLFFWDFFTMSSCSQPSEVDMLRLYEETVNQSGLTNAGFHGSVAESVDELITTSEISSCSDSRFDVYAGHNGIDN
ncbi:MAG: hypothetical protein V3W41_00570 [Planctomycetota bacterium]